MIANIQNPLFCCDIVGIVVDWINNYPIVPDICDSHMFEIYITHIGQHNGSNQSK